MSAGVLIAPAWQARRLVGRIRSALPSPPALAGKPAVLVELLATAEARARSSVDPLAGVVELARLYHANDFAPEAAACWELLRAEQPKEARWCYYLADLRRSASDYPAMAELLEETARLAPDYAPARLLLAEYEFKTGQREAAERNYRQRLALLPGDPYARLGLVRLSLQNGQRDAARSQLQQLVKDAADFSTAHNLYAEMLAADGDAVGADHQRFFGRETNRYRQADDAWLDELQAWCYDYARLLVLGTVDYQTAHGDRGVGFFQRAIRLRPDDPTAYEHLGTIYLRQGEAAKARDAFEDGLRHAGTAKPSAQFFVNLSHAYRDLKQPAEAVRAAQLGIAQDGERFELLDALGVAQSELGLHEAAVATLQAAVARSPTDANANYNLAVVLLAVHRLDDALEALHRSLQSQPTLPQTLLLLGRIELDSGHWDAAGNYFRPLYESHPEMPEARRGLATWHWRAGQAAEKNQDLAAAEQHYRDGLAVARDDPALQASLGVLCLVQNHFAEAIPPLEAFQHLQPENPLSALFLGEAYAAVGRRDDARKILTEGARIADRQGNPTTAQHCREILQQL